MKERNCKKKSQRRPLDNQHQEFHESIRQHAVSLDEHRGRHRPKNVSLTVLQPEKVAKHSAL